MMDCSQVCVCVCVGGGGGGGGGDGMGGKQSGRTLGWFIKTVFWQGESNCTVKPLNKGHFGNNINCPL